eukprot:TRINITY_DN3451_c0_g4_i1.p1 TRINITY_DN3451_c0_g4~~TRINITY_DN3451_c0_g4_i1.p1  ORF type:complete len:985 (-),score=214.67 TRINITY_DN3451_c0_g4_i1:243-3197(-)
MGDIQDPLSWYVQRKRSDSHKDIVALKHRPSSSVDIRSTTDLSDVSVAAPLSARESRNGSNRVSELRKLFEPLPEMPDAAPIELPSLDDISEPASERFAATVSSTAEQREEREISAPRLSVDLVAAAAALPEIERSPSAISEEDGDLRSQRSTPLQAARRASIDMMRVFAPNLVTPSLVNSTMAGQGSNTSTLRSHPQHDASASEPVTAVIRETAENSPHEADTSDSFSEYSTYESGDEDAHPVGDSAAPNSVSAILARAALPASSVPPAVPVSPTAPTNAVDWAMTAANISSNPILAQLLSQQQQQQQQRAAPRGGIPVVPHSRAKSQPASAFSGLDNHVTPTMAALASQQQSSAQQSQQGWLDLLQPRTETRSTNASRVNTVTSQLSNSHNGPAVPKDVKCGLCHGMYKDPRLLKCLHSFCRSCIQRRVDASAFECPSCATVVHVNKDDVDLLPVNAPLATQVERTRALTKQCENCNEEGAMCSVHCYQCDADLCDLCNTRLHTERVTRQHTRVPVSAQRAMMPTCSTHADEKLSLFCTVDNQAVCALCVAVGAHRTHRCSTIEDVHTSARQDVESLATQLRNSTARVEQNQRAVNQLCAHLEDENRLVAEDIHRHFAALHEALNNRERTLLSTAAAMKDMKASGLRLRSEQIERTAQQMRETQRIVWSLLGMGTETDMLQIRETLTTRLNEALQWDAPAVPQDEDKLSVTLPDDLRLTIERHGLVAVQNHAMTPASFTSADATTTRRNDDASPLPTLEEVLSSLAFDTTSSAGAVPAPRSMAAPVQDQHATPSPSPVPASPYVTESREAAVAAITASVAAVVQYQQPKTLSHLLDSTREFTQAQMPGYESLVSRVAARDRKVATQQQQQQQQQVRSSLATTDSDGSQRSFGRDPALEYLLSTEPLLNRFEVEGHAEPLQQRPPSSMECRRCHRGFVPSNNSSTACRHHAGMVVDAGPLKGRWTCCLLDWDNAGCRTASHVL